MSKLTLLKPQAIELTLGDTTYNVIYDFNAFAEMEEAFGSIQEAFNVLSEEKMTMTGIIKILRAGLSSNEHRPSEKELGSYISVANVKDVIALINDAVVIAMPKETKASKTSKN